MTSQQNAAFQFKEQGFMCVTYCSVPNLEGRSYECRAETERVQMGSHVSHFKMLLIVQGKSHKTVSFFFFVVRSDRNSGRSDVCC